MAKKCQSLVPLPVPAELDAEILQIKRCTLRVQGLISLAFGKATWVAGDSWQKTTPVNGESSASSMETTMGYSSSTAKEALLLLTATPLSWQLRLALRAMELLLETGTIGGGVHSMSCSIR